jgi:hypothetical protein
MREAQLNAIRVAVEQHPSVFDSKGRFTVTPGVLKLIGPVAISHRTELLQYVDALRAKLEAIAKILAERSEPTTQEPK